MTDFDAAASLTPEALTPVGQGLWSAQIPPDWLQGRTAFGGLVAALAIDAAVALIDAPERSVRSVSVAFVGFLTAGPVRVSAEVLAAGKAVTQVSVDLRAPGGALAARVHVVAGAARTSQIVIPGAAPAPEGLAADPADAGIEFPYIEGVTPSFTQNMAIRWCGENFPFTGTGPDGAKVRAWVRHKTAGTGLGAVVALVDTGPPAILPMMPGRRPASTVSWTTHLIWPQLGTALASANPSPSPNSSPSSGWFWLEADAVHAQDGYTIEQARLYSAGELVAWSEQAVAVYDRPAPVSWSGAG